MAAQDSRPRFLLGVLAVFLVLAWTVPTAHAASPSSSKVSEIALRQAAGKGAEKFDLIATFREPPGLAQRDEILALGGDVKREFNVIRGLALRLPANALQGFARNPSVSYVTIDAPVTAAAVDGAQAGDQLYPELASFPYTGAGVGIAVIDTGFKSHADLASLVAKAVTLIGGKADDGYGHGNHVIGTIAGSGSASGYHRGIAPDSSIYAVRALDDLGHGYTSDLIAGIDWRSLR